MKVIGEVTFLNTECNIGCDRYYSNDRTALVLYEKETGEEFCVASVNVDDNIKPDEVAIKNYNENEGVLETLQLAGIVSIPLRFVRSGFVEIPICKYLKYEPEHNLPF